ncbi:MFS transporter [Massilia endophytica]|uniref:MFS transporter n=1 Tax=Massilia endophytica TaxID=2899220 RepID=UPI001E413A58|nr:MFS transporter [Massilia endophytica]UGQ48681.1 MFS transporter [Massilia endophytica]
MGKAVRRRMLAILAVTQIASWGSLYYGIAILGPAIAAEMGWRNELVYGAYSWSLVLSGLAASPAGALLDRIGGRKVMGAGSVLAAIGMLLLGLSHSLWLYFLAWSVLGFAMAATLYEAAFAAINREFGLEARKLISNLTLFGGFASTVFWPLTLQLDGLLGWRNTCLAYAAMHLLLCLPLHLLLPAGPGHVHHAASAAPGQGSQGDFSLQEALAHPSFWQLAIAFAINSLIFSGLAVHLIPLLKGFGHADTMAVALAALIGPAQVAGRIAERVFFHAAPPEHIGRFAFAALPFGLLALLCLSASMSAAALFCLLLGASNGILTIVRGTVPQALYGRTHYGAIAGAMASPTLGARAAGPLLLAALLGAHTPAGGLLAACLGLAVLSLLLYLSAARRSVLQAGRRRAMMDPSSGD